MTAPPVTSPEAPAVVVIGGTGFVGSGLVERLAETGRVAMLSRSGRWRWGAPPVGVSGIACDISDRDDAAKLREAVREARVVVNLAGSLWRPALAEATYERVHVDGMRLLLDALRASAKERGPLRLVHVSTTGVLGPTGPDPKPETAEPRPSTEYERTKLEGERLALAARGLGLEVVVVRPGLVYGPRDLHLLPFFQSIDRGRFRPIARGSALWQPVYVADVVRGLAAAMTHADLDGAVLHLAGAERLTVAAFASKVAATMGREPHGSSIPYSVAFAAGAVLEALAAPFRADPPLTRARVRTLTQDRVYGIIEAERRLGWRPETPLDRGLAETIGWYRSQSLIGS